MPTRCRRGTDRFSSHGVRGVLGVPWGYRALEAELLKGRTRVPRGRKGCSVHKGYSRGYLTGALGVALGVLKGPGVFSVAYHAMSRALEGQATAAQRRELEGTLNRGELWGIRRVLRGVLGGY